MRELGSPNPVISFTWGCYRSLSGNRVGPRGGCFFGEVLWKSKGYSGHGQFGLLRDAPRLAPRVQLLSIFEKSTFFLKKTRFFSKKHGPSVPRGRRPLRVPLLLPLSMRALAGRFYFCKLHTFSFFWYCLGDHCSGGTPERVFLHFFRKRFRTRACTDLQCTFAQKCFFCNVKKVRSKGPIGYAAWGLPQGPAFACTLTILNKTKKQKLKKTQVLFGILISNKHFCARCENTKCLFDIRIPNKTCVFF